MLFTEVRNPIMDTKFLINIEQITSICVDNCSVWLADSDDRLTIDASSMNKILNILKSQKVLW